MKRQLILMGLVSIFLLMGCTGTGDEQGDPNVDSSVASVGDTDGDVDTDTDADTGTNGDTATNVEPGTGTGTGTGTGSDIGTGSEPVSCLGFPPLKVKDDRLVLNDGSERRYFLSGMVENRPSSGKQLVRYDHAEMEVQMQEHVAIGANAMRWNAFLKGADFTWDANGNITGMQPGCFDALRDGLDLARDYGILLQIVLSTAHFLQWGNGGESGSFNSGGTTVPNGLRVDNNYHLFTTDEGTTAYIQNVIVPMTQAIGNHPALMGYVIANEGYGMATGGAAHGVWSDVTITREELLAWINKVAGELNRRQPGVLLSVSTVAFLKDWYEDATLIANGGDPDGVVHVHQYQYYPENHNENASPFLNTPAQMDQNWGGTSKPSIAGEFPITGIAVTARNSVGMTLTQAYEALWNNGYSGGFTWTNITYREMLNGQHGGPDATNAAYRNMADLLGSSLRGKLCETH